MTYLLIAIAGFIILVIITVTWLTAANSRRQRRGSQAGEDAGNIGFWPLLFGDTSRTSSDGHHHDGSSSSGDFGGSDSGGGDSSSSDGGGSGSGD